MRKNLLELQEQMKKRAERIKSVETNPNVVYPIEQQKPRCSVPGCTRQARKGSSVCSRCSYGKQVTALRDTLPGVNPGKEHFNALRNLHKEDDELEDKRLFNDRSKTTISNEDIVDSSNDNLSIDESAETFSRPQVAKMLGVSQTTICRWEQKGKTPLPMKVVRNGKLIYTKEIVDAMREYMNQVTIAQPTPLDPMKRAAKAVVKKTFNLDKRLERTVATKLGGGGRNFGGAGRII